MAPRQLLSATPGMTPAAHQQHANRPAWLQGVPEASIPSNHHVKEIDRLAVNDGIKRDLAWYTTQATHTAAPANLRLFVRQCSREQLARWDEIKRMNAAQFEEMLKTPDSHWPVRAPRTAARDFRARLHPGEQEPRPRPAPAAPQPAPVAAPSLPSFADMGFGQRLQAGPSTLPTFASMGFDQDAPGNAGAGGAQPPAPVAFPPMRQAATFHHSDRMELARHRVSPGMMDDIEKLVHDRAVDSVSKPMIMEFAIRLAQLRGAEAEADWDAMAQIRSQYGRQQRMYGLFRGTGYNPPFLIAELLNPRL